MRHKEKHMKKRLAKLDIYGKVKEQKVLVNSISQRILLPKKNLRGSKKLQKERMLVKKPSPNYLIPCINKALKNRDK